MLSAAMFVVCRVPYACVETFMPWNNSDSVHAAHRLGPLQDSAPSTELIAAINFHLKYTGSIHHDSRADSINK